MQAWLSLKILEHQTVDILTRQLNEDQEDQLEDKLSNNKNIMIWNLYDTWELIYKPNLPSDA